MVVPLTLQALWTALWPPPVTRPPAQGAPGLGIPSPVMDLPALPTGRTVTAGVDGYDWLITSGPGSLNCGIAKTGRPGT